MCAAAYKSPRFFRIPIDGPENTPNTIKRCLLCINARQCGCYIRYGTFLVAREAVRAPGHQVTNVDLRFIAMLVNGVDWRLRLPEGVDNK